MPRSRPPYPAEFRQQVLELAQAGRTPEELAQEFEPTAQTIRNWIAQSQRDQGQRQDGLSSPEREEIARLRRENKQLRLEREILSKAAAWFARETGSIPGNSSTW
ncbi:MAG: transposase [Candidatus Handelsmanbacteria bacterium]|nr:transposase [Candidatus Handelsmanbacteria bacterium]